MVQLVKQLGPREVMRRLLASKKCLRLLAQLPSCSVAPIFPPIDPHCPVISPCGFGAPVGTVGRAEVPIHEVGWSEAWLGFRSRDAWPRNDPWLISPKQTNRINNSRVVVQTSYLWHPDAPQCINLRLEQSLGLCQGRMCQRRVHHLHAHAFHAGAVLSVHSGAGNYT